LQIQRSGGLFQSEEQYGGQWVIKSVSNCLSLEGFPDHSHSQLRLIYNPAELYTHLLFFDNILLIR
jgi:hypothetical protein